MPRQMDRGYFDEKKQLALDGIEIAHRTASEVTGVLSSWNYEVPNIVDPSIVHDYIRVAKNQLDGARYNFEKVRWSSADTKLEFDEWLAQNGCSDLINR